VPWIGLAISVGCLVLTSVLVARRLAAPGPDRYWIAIAASSVQLGSLFMVASALRALAPWPFLIAQLVLTGAVIVLVPRRRLFHGPAWPGRAALDAVSAAMLLTILGLLALSGVQQAVTPLAGPDEGMYHGPRIAYWLQEQTIFLARNHDDRQTVFPFGSELVAAWPLLWVRQEWVARMAFWTAFPGAAAGVWILARTIGAGPRAALAGTLLYVSTPTVLDHAASLKSDAWLPLFLAGAAYAAVRRRADGERPGVRFALSGLLLALAVNVKATALALAPGLVLAGALAEWPADRTRRALGGLGTGILAGAAVSGLGVLLVINAARYGRPLGPARLVAIVQPDFSLRQMLVHAVRAPIFLLELPDVPSDGVRAALERSGQRLARSLGATTMLQSERPGEWPGPFQFHVARTAVAYSLGGMVWLPVLGAGLVIAARQLRRTWPRPAITPAGMLAVTQVPLFLGVVLMIRWMNGGPYRFWLGAYALSIPLAARLVGDLTVRRPAVLPLVAAGLVYAAYPAVRDRLTDLGAAAGQPVPAAVLDRPYEEVTPRLAAGSRILLFAGANTREYGLFNPRGGFTNRVFPWGLGRFDPERADALVRERQITAIVVEHDEVISSPWIGGVRTDGVVTWARERNDFRELPLATPHMRLFERIQEP
jgi:hypothetical protein